ncbi:MAG: arylsulfotransferase family protein [Proteobacteria bacterium]|nr:arylsulfotransferase family protein [Pseudomonadota bacterium]
MTITRMQLLFLVIATWLFGFLLAAGLYRTSPSASTPDTPTTPPAPTDSPAPPSAPPPPTPAPAQRDPSDRIVIGSRSDPVELQQLMAMGYISGVPDPEIENSGVLVHSKEHAFQGLNFYHSAKSHTVLLVDMDGREVHRWVFQAGYVSHVHLLPNGDLIGLVEDTSVFKINKDSQVLWTHKAPAHHDLHLAADGKIYVLTRAPKKIPFLHPVVPVLDDGILILDSAGKPIDAFSFLATFLKSPFQYLRRTVHHLAAGDQKGNLDILHPNHIEVFDGRLAHRGPLYKKGNMLVGIRNNHSIGIIDGESRELVWLWGPSNLAFPHHPTLLENGNVLMFNNGAPHRKQSEVLEINPLTGQVAWRYTAKDFFSEFRGSNQRLPNGNTLITESDKGYVFEVTPGGKTVWRFANPDIEKTIRAPIWRMVRFAAKDLPFAL